MYRPARAAGLRLRTATARPVPTGPDTPHVVRRAVTKRRSRTRRTTFRDRSARSTRGVVTARRGAHGVS
ncbi:hypothetical protein J2Y89_000556 [Curtobacterium herbarum]|nr:hypothetical protein [Curtobacterium herbarum]